MVIPAVTPPAIIRTVPITVVHRSSPSITPRAIPPIVPGRIPIGIPGLIPSCIPRIIGTSPSIRRIAPVTAHNQVDGWRFVVIKLHQLIIITQDDNVRIVKALDAASVGKGVLVDGVTIDVNLVLRIISATTVVFIFIALELIIALGNHLVLIRNLTIDGNRLGRLLDLNLGCGLGFRGIIIDVVIVLRLNQRSSCQGHQTKQ